MSKPISQDPESWACVHEDGGKDISDKTKSGKAAIDNGFTYICPHGEICSCKEKRFLYCQECYDKDMKK